MEIVALVMWMFTAGGGLLLFARLLSGGGVRRQDTKVTRYPAMVVIGHPALAVGALATWIAFLVTDRTVFAWSAFATLVLVAMLGFTMFTRWLTGDGKHARDNEQAFPAVAVVAHGAVATLTFVLVLLTAITVSRS